MISVENIWPDWHIEKEIGRGSYGTVYLAKSHHAGIEYFSAVKVISIPSSSAELDSLRAELNNNEASLKTYLNNWKNDMAKEIEVMLPLNGMQNIVNVFDYKVVEKTDSPGWYIYIRMELLKPLSEAIHDANFCESDVIKIGLDICSALEVCGMRNIIHRDIKIENIFVNSFGVYKLGDFGIARKMENKTSSLSQKGTYNYMAPEVFKGICYDRRVDIYSLGIVLYKLLNNNRFPFIDIKKPVLSPEEGKIALERRMAGEKLPLPCFASPEIADIIIRACGFYPEERFKNVSEMKKALEKALASSKVSSTPLHELVTTAEESSKTVVITTDKNKSEIKTKKKNVVLPIVIASLVIVATLVAGGLAIGAVLEGENTEFEVDKNAGNSFKTVDQDAVIAAYKKCLEDADSESVMGAWFSLYDIDKNGVPELMINSTNQYYQTYSFDNELIYCGEIPAKYGMGIYDNYFLSASGGTGYSEWRVISMHDFQIEVSEDIFMYRESKMDEYYIMKEYYFLHDKIVDKDEYYDVELRIDEVKGYAYHSENAENVLKVEIDKLMAKN